MIVWCFKLEIMDACVCLYGFMVFVQMVKSGAIRVTL
jgi:hypothetical protein